jgi:prepilin-type N-terminal cleavage/methylation domain-containing protein
MFSIRSSARPSRRSPRRGVSLIELLVVLAILLLIFGIGGILIGPPLKKVRLASVANDITVLAQRLPIEARTQRGGQGLFVFLKATPGTGLFEVIADTGPAPAGDGRFRDPADATDPDSLIANIQPVRLLQGIVFYDMPAPYDNCWSNWGTSGTNFVLGMDFQGRTVGPDGRQIAGVASINLTHEDMASGLVTPLVVHRLTFGSVWGVRHTRLVKDDAVASGWREF